MFVTEYLNVSLKLWHHIIFSLLIVNHPNCKELFHDTFGRGIPGKTFFRVKANHVFHRQAPYHFEKPLKMRNIIFELVIIIFVKLKLEMHSILRMVLSKSDYLGISFCHDTIKKLFIVFSPFSYLQFFDMQNRISIFVKLSNSFDLIPVPLKSIHLSRVPFIPWFELSKLFSVF